MGGSSVSSGVDDDTRSIGSVASYGSTNGENGVMVKNGYSSAPSTPKNHGSNSFNDYGASLEADYLAKQADDWKEISCDSVYIPGTNDVGRKLKLECTAFNTETGELLMHRVVKTDIVLARAPDPIKRNLVTVKGAGGSSGGARFRIVTYNILAEIYATQQQYPYCDF